MSIEIFTTAALASAGAAMAKQLYASLLERRKDNDEALIQITIGENQLTVDPKDAPEILRLLKDELDKAEQTSGGDTLDLTRKAVARTPQGIGPKEGNDEQREAVGKIAFAIDPSSVLRDARRRIDLVFKFNFAVAIALAIVLVTGVAGCIVSAVMFKASIWTLAFGGIAAADILGIYVYKPLDAVNAAVIATQRLDAIHLRLREQLASCSEIVDLRERIQCQTAVWNVIQAELAALAA